MEYPFIIGGFELSKKINIKKMAEDPLFRENELINQKIIKGINFLSINKNLNNRKNKNNTPNQPYEIDWIKKLCGCFSDAVSKL